MKLKTLIKKLQKLENEYKDSIVVIDFDDNGFFILEDVNLIKDDGDDGRWVINLKSSNET